MNGWLGLYGIIRLILMLLLVVIFNVLMYDWFGIK